MEHTSNGEPVEWRSAEDIVATLELHIDPDDRDALIALLQEGMKRTQNTGEFSTWVSAYKFVQGVGHSESMGLQSLTPNVGVGLTSYRQQLAQSKARELAHVDRTSRRTTIRLSVATAIVVAVWTIPTTTNPLIAQISPFQEVRDSVNGETEIIFQGVSALMWTVALAVAVLLWIFAAMRHRSQTDAVTAAHEPDVQARALATLRRRSARSFTQTDFENQLIATSSRPQVGEELRLRYQRLPMPIRRTAGVLPLGCGVALLSQLDPAWLGPDIENSLYRLVVIFSVAFLGCLLAAEGLRLLLSPYSATGRLVDRAFSTTGSEEELRSAVRGASDLALERFVERGTLVAAPDVDYLPAFSWVVTDGVSEAATPPSG